MSIPRISVEKKGLAPTVEEYTISSDNAKISFTNVEIVERKQAKTVATEPTLEDVTRRLALANQKLDAKKQEVEQAEEEVNILEKLQIQIGVSNLNKKVK